MSTFSIPTDENVLLKSMTFLCKIPMESVKYLSCGLQCKWVRMLLQNVFFCWSSVIFSRVNLGRNINFCSNWGVSSIIMSSGISVLFSTEILFITTCDCVIHIMGVIVQRVFQNLVCFSEGQYHGRGLLPWVLTQSQLKYLLCLSHVVVLHTWVL